MKNILFIFFILLIGVNAVGRTFTIVNNSETSLYFQIFASEKNKCDLKFSSIEAPIARLSKVKYNSPAEIQWLVGGAAFQKKLPVSFKYTSFRALYIDASGGCEANASNYVGDEKCDARGKATLNAVKCGGHWGDLTVTWESENGDITVTIN